LRNFIHLAHKSEVRTTTRYACVLLCDPNSFPAQKHDGHISKPPESSHTESAHIIRMECVRSEWQPSHSICSPGSFTAVSAYVSRPCETGPTRGGRASFTRSTMVQEVRNTHFEFPQAGAAASGASQSFPPTGFAIRCLRTDKIIVRLQEKTRPTWLR
jgi:hypothetical protein